MQTAEQMCEKYVAELAAIHRQDNSYYLKPSPDRQDRQTYAARKVLLEELRSKFYAELVSLRQGAEFDRRCRSTVQGRERQHRSLIRR